ncbi:guanosine polyphosphate pyrophosphohydrolase [Campylobacterota bacterium]|nr:guanosine polyphosphate pyrophosphohydrolase [Campylobacterota bacterium]
MARVTAVIDIGSNSVRMAVFERTSRFGFHLLHEAKSRVRISENAYKNGGVLQPAAMNRAVAALTDFVKIAHSCKARKILTVATSAVRDAPNRSEFVQMVRAATKLNIRVIDGKTEALLGGIAACNLLCIQDGVTIDIGGGSTEFALIRGGRIIDTVSFNLGTVRLKELFFDDKGDSSAAERFVKESFKNLPKSFVSRQIIGVGGTLRALSAVIMKQENCPFEALHGYRFDLAAQKKLLERIAAANDNELKLIGFKPERFDVIREGVMIFGLAAKAINAKEAITSGVGVREGVFVRDLLRNCGERLPHNVQPSLISLLDRFGGDGKRSSWTARTANELFDLLAPLHRLDASHKLPLITAAKLLGIGSCIDYYSSFEAGYRLALSGLAYGYEHQERLLIASLILSAQKKSLTLPMPQEQRFLAFILFVANAINTAQECPAVTFALERGTLKISGLGYLAHEVFARFKPPLDIRIEVE